MLPSVSSVIMSIHRSWMTAIPLVWHLLVMSACVWGQAIVHLPPG